MTQKRVLITGINGFTGLYVKAALVEAGYEVFGIGSLPSDLANYFSVNLLDKDGLANVISTVQPNVVIHLAAIAFVGHSNADAFYQVNVLGTRNLLEALALKAINLEAVLLASSANVYGNSTEGVLTESMPPNPANDYAVSKLSMEYMAKLWLNRLPILMVRPFNYTGVGQSIDFLLPKIVAHFRRKADTIELGNLDVWRDFSDVRTVANIYQRLIEVKPIGQTINVCSGSTFSLREVIALAEEISGIKMDVKVNPAFVRANEVKILCGDTTLLHSFVGENKAISLNDTLRWMLTE